MHARSCTLSRIHTHTSYTYRSEELYNENLEISWFSFRSKWLIEVSCNDDVKLLDESLRNPEWRICWTSGSSHTELNITGWLDESRRSSTSKSTMRWNKSRMPECYYYTNAGITTQHQNDVAQTNYRNDKVSTVASRRHQWSSSVILKKKTT